MHKQRLSTVFFALAMAAAIATPGCATSVSQRSFWRGESEPNMMPRPWRGIQIYGGTALDLGIWGWLTGLKQHEGDGQDGFWVLLALDLPFSIAADTLLLPLTICEQAGVFGDRRTKDNPR